MIGANIDQLFMEVARVQLAHAAADQASLEAVDQTTKMATASAAGALTKAVGIGIAAAAPG